LQVGCERALGAPFMGRDASFGFGYFSLQPGDRLMLRLAARIGDLANPESGDFHRPEGFTVLPELNPVPGDIAIAVSDHGIAAC
jgi:hypothetical protein